MTSGYCDRSAELLLCAQLLRQKVMSGRTMLKPRKSRPGAVDTYFASTLFKTQFLPLINQVSTSLTLGQVKMNQLVSLTHRFSTACSPDATLVHNICKLVQELQPDMTTINTNLHHVAGVSSQVQMEFVGHPQFCKHVKALVTTQCARLAELSRRLVEFMEANRTLFSHEYFEPPGIDAPSSLPPTTVSSSVLRLQARAKRSPELHLGEGLRADVDPMISDSHHIQPQQQQQMVVRQREATSSVSAAAIRQTEATIVQLGQMYEQFAFLVREQADVVMRIDGNVEDATANVDWAHGNLIEFMRHVSGRRSLMFKFFASQQDTVSKGASSGVVKLPQKRLYRQRAHCNPWSDHCLNYPVRPDLCQWNELFDGKDDPPVSMVDVGCGYGGLLFCLSTCFPDSRIIGMEIRLKVVDYVQSKIEALRQNHPGKYRNIACIRTNAMKYLPNFFKKGQLEKMFFLYPDPHFKRHKHKWRIISLALLTVYAYVIRAGGRIYTMTDVPELAQWMEDKMQKHPLFRRCHHLSLPAVNEPSESLKVAAEEDGAIGLLAKGVTEEGQKAKREGRGATISVFERIPTPPMDE